MFGYQIDQHVPLASIRGWVEQQERHQTAVDFLAALCRLHDVVEEIVATLDFVPVEEERLRELELIQIVVLHEGQAYTIKGGKQPAATGAALIGDRFALRFHLIVEHMIGRLQRLAGQAHIERIHTGANVLGKQILGFAVEILAPLAQQVRRNGTLVPIIL